MGIGAANPDRRRPVEPMDPHDALEASQAADGPVSDAQGGSGLGPEWEFTLDHVDSRGRRWTGRFKAHVLTTRDRISVGLTRARMAAGTPYELLDPGTDQLLTVLAHLAVALDEVPPWAGDLMKVYDQGVIVAIYREVSDYEDRFHGADAPKPG